MSIKKIEDLDGRFKLGGFLGLFYLCGSIAIHYHTKISYESFLYKTFIFIALINTVGIMVDYFGDNYFERKRKKKNIDIKKV